MTIGIMLGNCWNDAARSEPTEAGEPGRIEFLPGAGNPNWANLCLHHTPQRCFKLA